MFLTGDGMRGGPLHRHISGAPLIGERQTAPRYWFYSVRDEFPALCPVSEGGQAILGELYDVPMGQLRELLERGGHTDITHYGGWRAYRQAR
jgi:gamma-glutamylcyclotransferase (GGCT)/AIG2-like uncharacterized protein YtfP